MLMHKLAMAIVADAEAAIVDIRVYSALSVSDLTLISLEIIALILSNGNS